MFGAISDMLFKGLNTPVSHRVSLLIFVTVLNISTPIYGLVGDFSHGVRLRESITVSGFKYSNDTEGCFLGVPRNLVVDIYPNAINSGPQVLDTENSGRRLCKWLGDVEYEHNSRKSQWETLQKNKRSGLPWYNVFRRTREYFRGFPAMKIEYTLTFIDLGHKDYYGNPLPWAEMSMKYICPQGNEGNNMFDDLCEMQWKDDPSTGKTSVIVLLSPPPTYNKPVTIQSGSTFNYLTGVQAGLQASREPPYPHKYKDNKPGISFEFTGLIAMSTSIMNIDGKLTEFWKRGDTCYFKSFLEVDWEMTDSICDNIATEINNGGLVDAIKSELLSTVKVYIRQIDLMEHRRCVFYGAVTEGILATSIKRFGMALYLDTNPQNAVDMKMVMNSARFTRAMKSVVDVVADRYRAPEYPQYTPSAPPAHEMNYYQETSTTTPSPYGWRRRSDPTNYTTPAPPPYGWNPDVVAPPYPVYDTMPQGWNNLNDLSYTTSTPAPYGWNP